MTNAQTDVPTQRKPLRLWPGVVIVIVQWFLRFVVPAIAPEDAVLFGLPLGFVGVLAGIFGGLAIVLWWLFFSRARWSERVGAVLLMVIALFVTSRIIHVSIANGAMGMLFPLLSIPILSLAFVVWAVATRRLPNGTRLATMVATIFLACGVWTLIRTGGFTADFDNDFAWRWTKTPEERLLAKDKNEPAVHSAPVGAEVGDVWPGFRGPKRDGIIHGVRIKTDWSASPPVELWRREIGPGWSSFAASGNLFYTQEQRGEDEIVACYNLTTGEPVWRHRDAARFWESNAGAGPRGTPTLSNGRVYTLGATGLVNALDARDGKLIWSRNAASDSKMKVPGWGFSSSPLVIDDVVIVALAGKLVAYDLSTGKPRWLGQNDKNGYSSPHLLTIEGATQVVFMNGAGVTSHTPASGAVLWKHPLPLGTRIVQPAMISEGDVLINDGDGKNMRRIAVAHLSGKWTVKERWTSIGLKPYFSDFVVHNGHAYGFDGRFLACIDIKDGNRKWKGGKYGSGQLILLADQNLLLVLSEQGELALVSATPDKFKELTRFPAIKGKTWNHPVLVGDTLLVRNAQEMAAFRLSLAGD